MAVRVSTQRRRDAEVAKVRLGDVAIVSAGQGAPQGDSSYCQNGGVPFVRAGHLVDLVNGLSEALLPGVAEDVATKHKLKLQPRGTVLFAKSGMSCTKGLVYRLKTDCYVVSHLATVKTDNDATDHYLEYYFQRNKPNLLIKDPAYPSLSLSDISRIEIPLPPLSEQKRIAEELDRICELKKNAEERLGLMDQLVKSKFVEMFGDSGKEVLLSDYVWFQEGPGVRSVDFCESGTVLLTGSNINNNCISFGFKSDRFISNEMSRGKYKHFLCDKGDVLAVTSAIEASRFDEKIVSVSVDKEYCLNTGIIRFKPNHNFLTCEYFKEFLKSRYFKNQVMSSMRGIAIMHFGPTHLKKMKILLPDSIEDQREFAAFVAEVDKAKAALKETVAAMETLYKQRLQEYFS